jgi:3-phosphoshikimate 1-carboxyvinyltransferase
MASPGLLITPARCLAGRVTVPGDKSISHRAFLLAALASGVSRVSGAGMGDDCRSTQACLTALGVSFRPDPASRTAVRIHGLGVGGLQPPSDELDAGNSGTTTRLLLGVLAGHPFPTRLTGDASLRRRPMRRILDPLERMGAAVRSSDGRLPIEIRGGALHAIDYVVPVASAQVKSGVMLAALHAEGTTTIAEPAPTRDHTERMLRQFGADVGVDDRGAIHVPGRQRLTAAEVSVPGDPSSAAFWLAAAAALPGSDIEVQNVSLNPTRTALLDVLRRAGAQVDVDVTTAGPEPAGTVRVRHRALHPLTITPAEVPGLIDEIPALAAMATYGGGLSVTGAAELRVKESDRITDLVRGLRALGASAAELPDGFVIDARPRLAGGAADACGDHRLAMAFAIAALGAEGDSTIAGADAVSVSYPGFFATLEALRR